MRHKQRVTVSLHPVWVEAAQTAVRRGLAASVSAWIDDALRQKVEREARLAALAAAIEAHEAEHGVITPEEIRESARRARSRAVVVRGRRPRRERLP